MHARFDWCCCHKPPPSTKSHAIIVTHLPHLYRNRVKILTTIGPAPTTITSTKKIRMVHIGRKNGILERTPDIDAVNCAARASHEDVRRLIEGLRLAENAPIIPLPGFIKKNFRKASQK
jgi:hypothetical protein